MGRRNMTVVGEKLGPEQTSDFLGGDDLRPEGPDHQGRRADTDPPTAETEKDAGGPLDAKTMTRRCGLVLERGSPEDRKRALRALNALYGEEP